MSRSNVVFKDLEKFQKKLQKLQQEQINEFLESCAKELAARLLAKVIKRTPVGDTRKHIEDVTDENGNKVTYKRNGKSHKKGDVKQREVTDHMGGNLRRGWTIGEIKKDGAYYIIEVINPVEYASYVEYGHRQQPGRYVPAIGKKLKQGWVEGKFMLTISEQELKDAAPEILEKKLMKLLGECFDD